MIAVDSSGFTQPRQWPLGPVCQVPGCNADLTPLRMYYQRCRICEEHHRAKVIAIEDKHVRFCQQCAALQSLEEFHSAQKSCVAALKRHKERREKKQNVSLLLTSRKSDPDACMQPWCCTCAHFIREAAI